MSYLLIHEAFWKMIANSVGLSVFNLKIYEVRKHINFFISKSTQAKPISNGDYTFDYTWLCWVIHSVGPIQMRLNIWHLGLSGMLRSISPIHKGVNPHNPRFSGVCSTSQIHIGLSIEAQYYVRCNA